MLRVIAVSSSNDLPLAKRLAEMVRRAWPGIDADSNDRVTIACGLRLVREIDLLVSIDLAKPRGGTQAGVIVIEAKQLDPERLHKVGRDIVPEYRADSRKRSVLEQVSDAELGLREQRDRRGMNFFIHSLVWLIAVPDADLLDVEPRILGESMDWNALLAAAAVQNASIAEPMTDAYRAEIRTFTDILTRDRRMSPRDKARVDEMTLSTINLDVLDGLKTDLGTKQIRLVGRAGSGKSSTLALLAKHASIVHGDRTLVLTFHRTLRNELEHLMRGVVGVPGVVGTSIVIGVMAEFFVDALEELGGTVPHLDDGAIDYRELGGALDACRAALTDDDVELLKLCRPERFGFEHVFVDEAQDWSNAERDFLRRLYAPAQLVLADGLDQLVTRQSPCDWNVGVPRDARVNRELNRTLRMSANVAAFVDAFAAEAGIAGWTISPNPALPGGRVILAVGPVDRPALLEDVFASAAGAKATPGDLLLCVPPTEAYVPRGKRPRRSIVGDELRARGHQIWDACDEAVRDVPPESDAAVRIVQYHSARGLEGWATVAFALDDLYANKLKHPNLAPGEDASPEEVAKRWLMIALTRAAHMLVVTVENEASPVADWLRAAAARMPDDVVEWR